MITFIYYFKTYIIGADGVGWGLTRVLLQVCAHIIKTYVNNVTKTFEQRYFSNY